jgi:hypothetical protein
MMNGRIGHLHCRYRIIGGRGSAGASPATLDHLARERVIESYAEALSSVLGDTAAVYVVRRVEVPRWFAAKADLSNPRLARRWGERMAAAVLRHIAGKERESDNIVSFTDQADYVAHFIADLMEGVAWDRWFYGAFSSLRPLSTGEALRRVLIDNREHLSAILGCLHRDRTLDKALSLIGARACRTIWGALRDEGLHSISTADGASLRPTFAGALELIDRLELWAQPRRDGEAMFRDYLATKPFEADWRDRRGLAAAIFDALSFFAARGYLRRMSAPLNEDFLAQLDRALAEFDWADADWLRTALPDLIRGATAPPSDLPARPAGLGATPRQRELIADLVATLRERELSLDLDETEVAANALKLYAALIARSPRWADDPAATGMIRQTLAAWSRLRPQRSIAETMHRLRERDIAGALRTLPEASRSGAEAAFKFLSALGDQAQALIGRLAEIDRKTAPAISAPLSETGVETDCAGVALLLRAMADARLPALVEASGFSATESLTPLSATLLALGRRWSKGPAQSSVDAGLSLMAGLRQPPAYDQLREAWSKATATDCLRFQSALLGVLAGSHFAQTSTLRLFRIAIEDGLEAVVAGDETATLWPMGRVIESNTEVAPVIADLLDAWVASAGQTPSAIIADDSLDWISDLRLEADAVHQAGRQALLEARGALGEGRLGLPEVDLTMALAAAALLRMWARWLRQFADSSVPYLLDNFIHRRGRVSLDDDMLWVEIERRPLDIVIEMAGYTADLERVAWLGGRSVRFRVMGQ